MIVVVRLDNGKAVTSLHPTKPSEFGDPPLLTVPAMETRHQSKPAVVMVGVTKRLVSGSTKRATWFVKVGRVM